MREITIDCTGIPNGAALHALLAERLEFPSHYGKNLDALYDCLTEISQQTQITICGLEALDFAEGFRDTLLDAEANSFWLHISFV